MHSYITLGGEKGKESGESHRIGEEIPKIIWGSRLRVKSVRNVFSKLFIGLLLRKVHYLKSEKNFTIADILRRLFGSISEIAAFCLMCMVKITTLSPSLIMILLNTFGPTMSASGIFYIFT